MWEATKLVEAAQGFTEVSESPEEVEAELTKETLIDTFKEMAGKGEITLQDLLG